MRRFGLITVLVVAAAAAAGGFFFVKHADADFVADLRGSTAPAQQVAQAKPATQARPAAPANPSAQPTPAAAPQEQQAETKTFARWTVACTPGDDASAPKKCTATNRIVDQKSGNALFIWVIGRDAQNNFVSYFQTPTGVLIGEGLTLIVSDTENYRLAFRSCDNRRCDVTAQMGADFVQKIAGISNVSARIVATTGQNVVFNIDNSGIAEAIKEL